MKRLIIINILLIIALNILPKEMKVEEKEEIKKDIITQEVITSRSLEEPRQENSTENDKIISKPTEISQEGIDFIKKWENCITVAKRLEGEKYFTLGYRTLW